MSLGYRAKAGPGQWDKYTRGAFDGKWPRHKVNPQTPMKALGIDSSAISLDFSLGTCMARENGFWGGGESTKKIFQKRW
jgi:hypothetical protein